MEEDYCKIMSERDFICTQLVCQNKDVDKLNKNIKDNNKTFPTRSTLDQRFVEIEGEPTAESLTAEMEVVPPAESPNKFIARHILDHIFAEYEGVPID